MEHTRVPHGLDLEAVPGGGGWLVVTAAGGSLPPHRRGRMEGGNNSAAAREAAVADVLRRCADAGRERGLLRGLPAGGTGMMLARGDIPLA